MSALVRKDSMAELISACYELPEIVLPDDVLAHGAWLPNRFITSEPQPEWDATVAAIASASRFGDWQAAADR